MKIDFITLFILITSTISLYMFFSRKQDAVTKFAFISLMASYFCYSGFGLCYLSSGSKYIAHYIVYLVFLLASICFALRFEINKNFIISFKAHLANNKFWDSYYKSKITYICKIGTIVLFFCMFTYIVYPEFRFKDFFFPPNSSLPVKLQRFATYKSLPIFSVIDLLITVCIPLFLIYLKRLKESNQKLKSFLLFILFIYLDYLKYTYLGRHEMTQYFLLLTVYFFIPIEKLLNINIKTIFATLFVLVVIVPYFSQYIQLRQGVSVTSSVTTLDAFLILLETETYYPVYYDVVLSMSNNYHPITYILSIFSLPIPSVLWPEKPKIIVNDYFTELVTGKSRGMLGYSVELPSLLGEAFFVFGDNLFFMHAIITGILIGFFFRFYKKYEFLNFVFIYFAVMMLVIGRGGTGSFIPKIINGSIPLMLIMLCITKYRIKI